MKFPHARILVFCKAPVPGQVKTRLAQGIGDIPAARLHESLAHHCLQNLTTAGVAPVQLWCAPDRHHPFFRDCRARYGVELHEQAGDDLGGKMLHAIESTLGETSHCVVVGTDCPVMDGAVVRQALEALHAGADGVIAPAEDGGYALVGMSRAMPAVFSGISWGSSDVMAQTRLKMSGRWRELATLWDIDRPEDLQRLLALKRQIRADSPLAEFLAAVA